jgi:PAS domain S-box-containing protein
MIRAITGKMKTLFLKNVDRECPATFKEELNYHCDRILLFASLTLIFVWLPYITVDQHLHPEEPLIVSFRLGLSVVGLIVLILYLTKKYTHYSLLLLTIMGFYLEGATGIITALSKGDSVYIGGYLFVLGLLAVVPYQKISALLILSTSLSLFFIVGFIKGMSFNTFKELYSLRDLLTTFFVTAFFIFLLNNMRYRNWQNSRKIFGQHEELKTYKELITNIPVGIFSLTMDGNFISKNPAFHWMCGINQNNLSGEINFSDLFADPVEFQKIKTRLLAEGQIGEVELQLKRMDGTSWIGNLAAAISHAPDILGKDQSIDGIIEDITERKKAAKALQESERYLTEIINFLPLATMVIDRSGKVTAWNHEMEEMTGIKYADIIEKGNYEYALPFYGERKPILIDSVFIPTEKMQSNYRHIHRKGKILSAESFIPKLGENGIILEGFATALYDSDGNIIGAIESIRDITKIKRAEVDLKDAKEAAEAANRSKSAFLANMSHEIRTPMNAILGFAEILSSRLKDPELANYTSIITSSGNALLTIINDILDLSKIEAGKIELDPVFIDLEKIIQEIKQLFIPTLQEKELELFIEIDKNLPKGIYLDEVRIRQIIMNLVGNAVKFTEKGYVKIYLNAICNSEKDLNSNYKSDIKISIEDTGIGIPNEHIEKIFQPFEQADGQSTRKFGGTGLGLSISNKLITMMGGSIDVKSENEKGSIFTIILPNVLSINEVENRNQDQDAVGFDIIFDPAKILVVDDIEANRELVNAYLREYNLEITEAKSGDRALEEIKKDRYDLILLDRKMPGMSGEEVAAILKADEITKNIPIVMFTASAFKYEEESIGKIVNGFLTKPVNKIKLLNEIKKYLSYKEKIKSIEIKTQSKDSKTEEFISDDQKELLIKILEGKHTKEWKVAIKTRAVGNAKIFALNLQKTAEKFNSAVLKNYSNELLEFVNIFNISKIKNHLNEFSKVLEKIRA